MGDHATEHPARKVSEPGASRVDARSRDTVTAEAQGSAGVIGGLQRSAGNRAVLGLLAAVQPKLEVGAADDVLEANADQVARQVVQRLRQPDRPAAALSIRRRTEVQRAVDPGPGTGAAGGTVNSRLERALRSAQGHGSPLPHGVRTSMEGAFGADFSDVKVHSGHEASELSGALHARAFTLGNDIFFRRAPDYASGGGQELLAHELTHTLQQGASRSSGVARAVRALDDSLIQRAIATNGGTWDTDYNQSFFKDYVPPVAGYKNIGETIKLRFTPNDLIVSDKIGLTQTVKGMKSTSAAGAVNVPYSARHQHGAGYVTSMTGAEGEEGRGIDRVAFVSGTDMPALNPMYGGTNAGTLEGSTTGGNAHYGYRKVGPGKDPGGQPIVAVDDAWLTDAPSRPVKQPDVDVKYDMTFETAALALSGPQANSYLGSVEWGWSSDDHAAVTLKPFKMTSPGAATQSFMDAARKWNQLSMKEKNTATEHELLSLPTTTSAAPAKTVAQMTTAELVARDAELTSKLFTAKQAKAGEKKLTGAAKHAADRTNVQDVPNLEFERTAIRAELRKPERFFRVVVTPANNDAAKRIVKAEFKATTNTARSKPTKLEAGKAATIDVPMKDAIPTSGAALSIVTLALTTADNVSQATLATVKWALPLTPQDRTEGGYALSMSVQP